LNNFLGLKIMETEAPSHSADPEAKAKPVDRRIHRTQQSLQEALLALILEKGYDDITVQDIIDRANVGRSTFYAHFLDKDHLFMSGFERLRQSFEEQHRRTILALSKANPSVSRDEQRIALTLVIFQHVQGYARIYKALLGKRGGELATQQMNNYITELLRNHLSTGWLDQPPPAEIPLEILVQFMASTLMSLLSWWLDHAMSYSAEQMNRWFYRLAIQHLQMDVP
jgi:AcrR family transcriptional regulator